MANNLIDSGWNRKVKLTVNKTYVSADQTNFPVMLLWDGVSGNLPTEIFNNSSSSPKSDGRDIRFSQDYAGNIELPFEIVNFEPNSTVLNARVELHTKLTNVYTASDSTFYMWWDNASVTAYDATEIYGKYNVWCDKCIAAYHLNESTGTVALNSALASFDGTYLGTSFPNRVDSPFGYAQAFNATKDNYVSMGNDSLLDITGSVCISAVVSVSSWTTNWQAVVCKGDFAYRLHRKDASNTLSLGRSLQGGGYIDTGSIDVNDGSYHHAFGRFDVASGTQIFIDGTGGALNDTTTLTASSADIVTIGKNISHPTRDWSGNIGEVRIYNEAKSDSWITAEYNTLMNFTSFISADYVDNVNFSEIGSNF